MALANADIVKRFAAGAVAAGVPVFVLFLASIILTDMPTQGDSFEVPADYIPGLGGVDRFVFATLLIAPVAIAFAIGWRGRGSAILGALLGSALGGYAAFRFADDIAKALNPYAYPLLASGGGFVWAGYVALFALDILIIGVVGLLGWAIGRAARHRRAERTTPTT